MQVHGGLGRARRARGVEPEGHRVEADGLRGEPVVGAGDELREVDDRPQVWQLGVVAGNDASQRRVGHEHPGSTVAEHVRPLGGAEPRVEGHRDRADPKSAEERGHPGKAVRKEHGHALLGLDTEGAQPLARAGGQREHLGVGCRGVGRDDGGRSTVPGPDAIVEKRRDRVGDHERGPRGLRQGAAFQSNSFQNVSMRSMMPWNL